MDEWRARYRKVRVVGPAPDVPALWKERRGEAQELLLDDAEGAIERRLACAGARIEPLPLRLDDVLSRMVA